MPETLLEVRVVLFSLSEAALQVFLVRQDETRWALPGCPARGDESLEETALRALYGEFERNEIYLEQLYTYGGPARAVSVVYFALVPHNERRAAELRQHRLDALPALMDDHAEIIAYALRRLRYKLEYSAAGFELLPEEFTLTELQHTYEIILGEKLDKRNFRRRILDARIIEETPHLRGGEGRPARLYRYRPDAVAEVKTRRLFP
ncbi:MAG: NUDIX domain-containing protein [Anaerolineales bacterium]